VKPGAAPRNPITAKQALKTRFKRARLIVSPKRTDAVLAQQLAILLLKRASAMVLLLCPDVLQHGLKLTRAYRKRAVAALPEKTAIPSIERFDPFRRCFLYLLDQLSLGKSSWQRRNNMNVISDTPEAHKFGSRSR